jgi:hypothetical protein
VVIVLAFISLITYVCCEDKKYEKEKFDEARKVK